MKHKSYLSAVNGVATLAALLAVPSGLQAAQMAYEGFNYTPGTSNLSGFGGGTGWNGVWQTVNGGTADVVAGSLVAPTAPSGYDLRSFGNSVNLANARRVGRLLDTTATGPFGSRGYRDGNGRIGADGKTVYVSFMQQPNGTTSYYEFEFHRGSLGDAGRIAGIGNDQGGDNVNLRAPNNAHSLVGPGNAGVNFYVVRIDFKPGNDDVYVYQNPTSLTEPSSATLVKTAVADMSFDGVSFGAFVGSRTVAHDEVRIGESWADVTIPVTALPVITSQPRATTTGFTGASVTLSVQATGQPVPTYQWYKGQTALSGQTASSLTLSNLQAGDAGAYHVKVTNSQGTVPSSDAQLTVVTPPAGLLTYEGFDYNSGTGNLPGKSGGFGWGAPWTNVNGGGSSVTSAGLIAGNNAPNGFDNQSLGNANNMPNSQRDGRLVDTAVGGRLHSAGYIDGAGNVGMDGKTLYLSFLQQPDGTTKFYEFEFHRGNLGDPGRIGGIGNDSNNATVSLRTGSSQALIGPGSTGVNLYVVRIDFKPGNDDVYVYQNPLSATEPATPTLVKLGASDMSFNGLSLAAFDNGRTVKHDEIRLGQSWGDVVFGTSRRQLTWVGDGTTNAWNLAANNWTTGTGTTAFVNGDAANFNDSGSATPAVSIPAAVSTSSVNVNNSTKNYTLSGAGPLSSSGGLHKTGTGSLTLTAPSSFGSAVVVDGGTLSLNGTTTVGGDLNTNVGTVSAILGGNNTFSGTLNGTEGTHTLSGTNSFAGLVTKNGSYTISGPTTLTGGGVVWLGNLTGSSSALTIENGGSLNITGTYNDALVVGRDGGNGSVVQNGGTVTYNPSNQGVAFIGASDAVGQTVASYTMNGGTLEMSSKRLGLAIGNITSNLHQNGGTINVAHLDLGANRPTGTGIYNLAAGRMNIGGGGITSFSAKYELNLGAGTIGAAANWTSSLDMTFTGTGGNTTFDTAGNKVVLSGILEGTGGVVKTGAGTLVLNGSTDYSGPTMVNAGKLGGFGFVTTSAISVASGAAIAPGNDDISVFTANTVSFAAGSSLEIEMDAATAFADQLMVSEAVNVNGVNLVLTDLFGDPGTQGSSFVILQSGTAVNGQFAGLAEGASVTVGVNTFTIHYEFDRVSLTLTGTGVSNPYTTWASANGLDGTPGKSAAFNADPDNDGVGNGLEWILGGNPLAGNSASLVTVSGSAATGITLTFNRLEASIAAAPLYVQWSTSLTGPWTDVPVTEAGGSHPNGVVVTVNQTPTPDAVTVQIPASNAANGKLFARLRAVQP